MGKYGIWQSVLWVAAAAATTGAVMSSEDNDGRIDYIEFRAANLEETKAFYGGVAVPTRSRESTPTPGTYGSTRRPRRTRPKGLTFGGLRSRAMM